LKLQWGGVPGREGRGRKLMGGRCGRTGRGRWGSGSRLWCLSQRSSGIIRVVREESKSQFEGVFWVFFLFFSSSGNRTMGLCL
jgi:hypothetical protein